jgi:hypothetical protein
MCRKTWEDSQGRCAVPCKCSDCSSASAFAAGSRLRRRAWRAERLRRQLGLLPQQQQVGDYAGGEPRIVKRGALPFPGGRKGYGTAIAKSGNYLYVANDSIAPSRSYLTIVNVSNPATPSVVADLALPSSVPSTLQIVKNGNYLYMFPESGDMQVVDVSNPAAPAIVRSVSMTASGGVVVGNRLYTAERANGVGVWDVSQPDNPTRIGSVSLSGNITEVAVSGSTLYALSGFGSPAVHLLSLATPDAPTLQSTFNTNYVADMVVYGNYLYLSMGLATPRLSM